MPIPALNDQGHLPPGVHDCELDEIRSRFGTFQTSDRRPNLFVKLESFIVEARSTRLVLVIFLDGSFVTADPEPNDVDMILVVPTDHDFAADLPIHQYNLLAQRRVRRRFGFDIVVVKDHSSNLSEAVAFFSQVRQRPGEKKGPLRLHL